MESSSLPKSKSRTIKAPTTRQTWAELIARISPANPWPRNSQRCVTAVIPHKFPSCAPPQPLASSLRLLPCELRLARHQRRGGAATDQTLPWSRRGKNRCPEKRTS
jgi:hypothetical protein